MKSKGMIFAAVAEAATGLALLVAPSLVGQLLLGQELSGVAVPVARVLGIALVALAISCWPGTPLLGMLSYSAAVTFYFLFLGVQGKWVGSLLWPAAVLHGLMTVWCLASLRTITQQIRAPLFRPRP
jgi:hypothetical protein